MTEFICITLTIIVFIISFPIYYMYELHIHFKEEELNTKYKISNLDLNYYKTMLNDCQDKIEEYKINIEDYKKSISDYKKSVKDYEKMVKDYEKILDK